MKTYANEKMIKRNGRIGNITSILSVVILGVGMVFSFRDKDGSYLPYTFSALIVGFLLFQIGNYFMSKWGKSPRPDELISQALKGLDDKYSLYHYKTDVSHLLIGPSGVYALLPFNQNGKISYDGVKNRWKQKGGNAFLKIFGGEGLGRPDLDVKYAKSDIQKFFIKKKIDIGDISPEVILVFTNEKAELNIQDSIIPAVPSSKLKDYIRKRTKTNPMTNETQNKIHESITK